MFQIFHPDKAEYTENTERFAEICKAYEILSDPEKRALYDKPRRQRRFIVQLGTTKGANFPLSSLVLNLVQQLKFVTRSIMEAANQQYEQDGCSLKIPIHSQEGQGCLLVGMLKTKLKLVQRRWRRYLRGSWCGDCLVEVEWCSLIPSKSENRRS